MDILLRFQNNIILTKNWTKNRFQNRMYRLFIYFVKSTTLKKLKNIFAFLYFYLIKIFISLFIYFFSNTEKRINGLTDGLVVNKKIPTHNVIIVVYEYRIYI